MRKLVLMSSSALALFSASAFAADLPVRGPAIAPAPLFIASNWSGFYTGAQIGWSQMNNDAAVYFSGAPIAGWEQGYSSNGVVGGLYAGYAMQTGSIVYGAELDVNLNSVSRRASAIGSFDFSPDTARVRMPFEGALVGKIGVAVGPSALIYALGGVALAQVETRYNLMNYLTLAQSNTDTRFGWTLGAGAAMKISPNWSARLEYRYANYGSETHNLSTSGYAVKHDLYTHRLMAGLTYHFGGVAGPVVAKY